MPQHDPTSVTRLFLVFLRLGLTAFGGPAMVPYVRKVAVEQNGWLTPRQFQDGVALCQSIPGATVMQLVAYIGLRVGGSLASLACFVAFGLPAFVLMLVLTAGYARTRDVSSVLAVFAGLQVIVVALVANAAYDFGRKSIKDWRDGALALGAGLLILLGGSPIIAICGAALAGLLVYRGTMAPETAPAGSVAAGGEGATRGAWLAMAALVWWFLFKTRWGFDLRAVGLNPRAARYAGMMVSFTMILAMSLSGALAGMAGANEVLGVNHNLAMAFSSGYGFDSIALALLGNSHPVGVVLSALLFGALRNGATNMQLKANIPIDIISIFQALILVFIATPAIIRTLYRLKPPEEGEEGLVVASWGGN